MKHMEKAIKFNRTCIVFKKQVYLRSMNITLAEYNKIISWQHSTLLHYMYIYFTSTIL